MFAFSGILDIPPGEKGNPAFLEYAVSLAAGDGKKRVCSIPTATGDSPSAIDAVGEAFAGQQDVAFSVLTVHEAQRARCRGASDGLGRPAGRRTTAPC